MGSPGASPKVITVLREGYTLPFRFRPNLTRSPTVISNYVIQKPPLVGGLASAGEEKYSRTGSKSKITGVLQQAIFGTQTQQPVETYLGPEHLVHLPKHRVDARDTRTSLQVGEWVTSIDFKYTYFYIPIHSQSRKYMCFHVQGLSYQFKVLPFGLSTAPMEFTVVTK